MRCAVHARPQAAHLQAPALRRAVPRVQQPRSRFQRGIKHTTACAAAAADPAWETHDSHAAPLRTLALTVAAAWHALLARVAAAVQAAKQQVATVDADAVNAQIRTSVRNARMLTMVAPFAAAGTSYGTTSNTLLLLTRAVASFIKVFIRPSTVTALTYIAL